MQCLFGGKGIFVYSPLALLGVAGLARAIGKRSEFRREAIAIGAATFAFVLSYALLSNNYGGSCYSVRWFVDFLPLVWFFGFFWFEAPSPLRLWLFRALFLAGVFFGIAGAWHPFRTIGPHDPPAPLYNLREAGYWLGLAQSEGCHATAAAGNWSGEYFDNETFTGLPVMARDDGDEDLRFDWGAGGPELSCNLPVDGFSVRWTRTTAFRAGTYRFSITTDDGMRLKVDGRLILDKWLVQPPTTYSADIVLSAGNHTLEVEYFEREAGATAAVRWALLP
jgi:hypothetical protein